MGLHRVTWGYMHEAICAPYYTWGYTGLLKATQGYRGLQMATQGYIIKATQENMGPHRVTWGYTQGYIWPHKVT